MAEYHPIVIIARHISKDSQDLINTISSLDTLKFIGKYEVTHFGGKNISNELSIELLLTPGYIYRFITDDDLALSYIKGEQLTLPTQ